MATSGNLATDILIIWLPLVLAVIMGLLGLLRGARREAVVSLAIVLAALIISVWSGPWSTDLHSAFSSLDQQTTQTWLGVIVFVLITLVVGYGLGSVVTPRGRMSGMSRLGGFLFGLANGAALGGWLLRNYYNSLLLDLSGQNNTIFTTLTDNIISRSLIIWAGWFPLAVALAAAIVALVGPFRRAQTVVATPSPQTNWTPSTAPAVTAATTTTGAIPTSYTPQYPQQYAQPQQSQQYTQPYAQQQYQPQFGVQSQPQAAPVVYPSGGYGSGASSAPQPARVQDAPPTMPMPTGDTPRPAGGQETNYFGSSSASSTPAAPPASSSGPSTSSGVRTGAPHTGPLGDLPDTPQNKQATPSWSQPPDSSWLSAPRADSSSPSSPSSQSSAVARSEAPTMAYSVTSGSTQAASPGAITNCPQCGALVPADAAFCTECGHRLKS